jgi:hypothetical protein
MQRRTKGSSKWRQNVVVVDGRSEEEKSGGTRQVTCPTPASWLSAVPRRSHGGDARRVRVVVAMAYALDFAGGAVAQPP